MLYDQKIIKVERVYEEDEADFNDYNRYTIEVTGMSQMSSKYGVMLYFESKKGANADVQSIDFIEEEEMYLIRFKSEDGMYYSLY